MSDQENEKPSPSYDHNILEGFGTGALLDLRVRMAIGFLNTSPIFGGVNQTTPTACALFALELAEALMKRAEERGWVQSLDSVTELSESLIRQSKLSSEYDMRRQLHAQEFAEREQSGLAAPVGGGFPIAPGGRGGRH